LKFETHAIQNNIDPLDQTYTYYSNIRMGLDYIFLNAYTMAIGMQPYGNPDTDGDGIGVYFVTGGGGGPLRTYETGIAMMAIVSSTHPGMVINVPGSAVNGWKYRHVVEDAVDYLAFGQNDAGTDRGGWGYWENQAGWSDNVNTGYAVSGLAYAQASPPGGFGLTVPDFVKNELDVWIEYIQNKDGIGTTIDPIGGSGYDDPHTWINILKTGHLLYEMWFVGDTATTPRVIAAINYLVRHWADANDDPGWRGSPASYQAMYTTMKGLRAFGIEEIDGIDWQADFEGVLIAQQLGDGSWPSCDWDTGDLILATEWALLTLEKEVPPPPPPTLQDIEDKLDLWLPEIKKEIEAIELKLDKWLPEINNSIAKIELKLDLWLPEIKKEIIAIEYKLDYIIDKEAVEVEVLKGTPILKDKFVYYVYYMMTTVAGQKRSIDKIEIETESTTIDPSQYIVTELKAGVYRIEIKKAAVPFCNKLIIIQVQYEDPISGVVYYGAAMTTVW